MRVRRLAWNSSVAQFLLRAGYWRHRRDFWSMDLYYFSDLGDW